MHLAHLLFTLLIEGIPNLVHIIALNIGENLVSHGLGVILPGFPSGTVVIHFEVVHNTVQLLVAFFDDAGRLIDLTLDLPLERVIVNVHL